MTSPTRRAILIRLLGAASAGLVGAGKQRCAAAPLGQDDPVKRAVDASRAAVKAIQSGVAVVAFETYLQEPEDKDLRLWAKGQADIYFDGRKNHIRFKYETKLSKIRYVGRTEEKIVERKPKDLAVIYDGTKAHVVTYFDRPAPPRGGDRLACRVEIHSGLDDIRTEVQGDPTQFWLSFVDLEGVMKTVKRDAMEVTERDGGVWRLSYQPFARSKDRFEIEISSKADYNPTRFRVVNPAVDKPAYDCSAKWTKSGEIWYVEELVKDFRYRSQEKPGSTLERSVFRYKSFKPNAKVDAKLFTLDCLTIPPGSRTFDRRPPEKR